MRRPCRCGVDAGLRGLRGLRGGLVGAALICAIVASGCASQAPAASIGSAPSARPRGVYINIATILHARTRGAWFDRLAALHPDLIVIYGMHRQLRNSLPASEVLRSLQLLLPDTTLAVSGESAAFFSAVAADRNLAGLFGVYNYEFEFWNPGNYGYRTRADALERACTDLAEMRVLADRMAVRIEMYLGWFDEAEALRLFPLLDGILLHAYVPSPGRIEAYLAERLAVVRRLDTMLGRVIEWRLLLSAETRFLGTALRARGLDSVESEAVEPFAGEPGWSGIQWFTAELLYEHPGP